MATALLFVAVAVATAFPFVTIAGATALPFVTVLGARGDAGGAATAVAAVRATVVYGGWRWKREYDAMVETFAADVAQQPRLHQMHIRSLVTCFSEKAEEEINRLLSEAGSRT